MGIKFNTVLFDNMKIKNLKLGVKLAKKYYETEASGNITLKNVKSVAATGVDRISVGSITHSAPAMDFKLEIWINYFFSSAWAAARRATGTL